MKKYLVLALFFFVSQSNLKAQGTVDISPEYARRGDTVVIIYHQNASGNQGNTIPVFEFTYTNFYELPQKIEMRKQGSNWRVSFKLPAYAAFASFVINDGDKKITPSSTRHYEIPVYDDSKKRVEKGFLYQGYSLGAQMAKASDVKEKQAALYLEELKGYPESYEARLNLLSYKISGAEEKEKEKLYNEANEIIAQKFYSDPGKMGVTNLTTMGYLMMGEKTRLDSLRLIIREKYPTSEAGYELRISDLIALNDSVLMVKGLEEILQDEKEDNKSYFTSAHNALFKFYAAKGNLKQTLHHLSFLQNKFTPYTPAELAEP